MIPTIQWPFETVNQAQQYHWAMTARICELADIVASPCTHRMFIMVRIAFRARCDRLHDAVMMTGIAYGLSRGEAMDDADHRVGRTLMERKEKAQHEELDELWLMLAPRFGWRPGPFDGELNE